MDIKEVRLSVNIDTHDFDTKVGHACRFLKGGDNVKVSVRFRGRELHHTKLGEELLQRFAAACSEFGTVDKPPKLEGRNMALTIVQKKV